MKRKARLLTVCGAILLSATTVTNATGSDMPYRGILMRNVFGLKSPEPIQAAPVARQLPKITLTAIHTILGPKYVNLLVEEPGKTPGPQPAESLMLTEGIRVGGIEVLAINENAGSVRISNHGEVQLLDFKNNGSAPSASAPNPLVLPVALKPLERPIRTLPPPMRPNLSPEEQVIAIEVERLRLQNENDPTAAMLPPTELTPR